MKLLCMLHEGRKNDTYKLATKRATNLGSVWIYDF